MSIYTINATNSSLIVLDQTNNILYNQSFGSFITNGGIIAISGNNLVINGTSVSGFFFNTISDKIIINNNSNTTIIVDYDNDGGFNLNSGYKFEYTSTETSITIIQQQQACFSYATLQKILLTIPKQLVITLKSKRINKKMIRVIHEDLGELEFTHDHPFLYQEKIISFEKLVELNPKFSNSKNIPLEECETIYNIVGHPFQNHPDNIFILSDDLHMLGAQYPKKADPQYFLKKKEVFNNLINDKNPENVQLIKEKYGII